VVVEISVFNAQARFPVEETNVDTETQGAQNVNQARENVNTQQGQGLASCTRADLFPLAQKATNIRDSFESPGYMVQVLEEMQKIDNPSDSNPLRAIYLDENLKQNSKVVALWTVRNELNDPRDTPTTIVGNYRFFGWKLGFWQKVLLGMMIGSFLTMVLLLCYLGFQFCVNRYKWDRWRRRRSHLVHRLRDRQQRGIYGRIRTIEEEEDEDSVPFLTQYQQIGVL